MRDALADRIKYDLAGILIALGMLSAITIVILCMIGSWIYSIVALIVNCQ